MTTNNVKQIPRRVAKGAALLDNTIPDWYERIDIEILDIGSCTRCILGQLGDFLELCDRLYLPSNIISYGFDMAEGQNMRVYVEQLTVAWRDVILQRRSIASTS